MTPLLVIELPEFDTALIRIGWFELRWYALAYLFGLILAYVHMRRLAARYDAPVTREHLDDFLTWATLGVVLGGRLGFVLFYNLPHYLDHPLDALKVWQGGMSFHGGFLGVTVALLWFTRAQHIPLFRFTDMLSCAAPIGLFLGRIANFINGELWGRPSDAPWAMVFPDPRAGGVPRHPSQLYEAFLEGVVLFTLCNLLYRQKQVRDRPGLVTGCFVGGYGLARFVVEYVRQPDDQFEGTLLADVITMGQILSLPMIALGLVFILRARAQNRLARA